MSKGNGTTKPDEKPRELPIVKLDQLKLTESVNNQFTVMMPDDLKASEATEPAVWSVVAYQFTALDLIRAYFPLEEVWAELLVTKARTGHCTLVMLRSQKIGSTVPDSDDALPANHKIEWHHTWGWTIYRTNPDGSTTILGKGSEHGNWEKKDARRFLEDHATIRQSAPGRLMVR